MLFNPLKNLLIQANSNMRTENGKENPLLTVAFLW